MTQTERTAKVTGGQAVNESQGPDSFGRSIPFSIDGEPFDTNDLSQKASALLQLAELDPANYDLVIIEKDARFVSIRQKGPVA